MVEVLLGQIPEAIFFSLFMIYAKEIKEKRIIFIVLMIFEYLLLKHFIKFDIWFQIGYTIITYLILKLLYKEKAQITDVFTFGIASLVLIISSILSFFIFQPNMILVCIFNRIILFIPLILFRNKMKSIKNIYKKFWNRNDKIKKKVKSTTFRAFNLVAFNIMFFILNLCMEYAIHLRK